MESADRDEKVEFRHGNTAYEQSDHEELSEKDLTNQRKRPRQKQSQLLSGEDLTPVDQVHGNIQFSGKICRRIDELTCLSIPSGAR